MSSEILAMDVLYERTARRLSEIPKHLRHCVQCGRVYLKQYRTTGRTNSDYHCSRKCANRTATQKRRPMIMQLARRAEKQVAEW